MCPIDCAASTTVTAPTLRARAQSSATGLIVPSVLETCVKAKTLTSGRQQAVQGREVEEPLVAGHGHVPQRRAGALATSCQGTRLLWCSISVSRMTSPFPRFAPPQLEATRLMDSVVPRVKMISSGARR
jgi:hypothetical protein